MADKQVGSLYNSLKFRIDNSSWKALDRFQKRLGHVQKQMKAMQGGFSIKANVSGKLREATNNINKIEKLKVDAAVIAAEKVAKEKAAIEKKLQTQQAREAKKAGAEDARRIKREAAQKAKLKQQHNLAEIRYMKIQEQARLKLADKENKISSMIGNLQGKSKTHRVDMSAVGGFQARFSAAQKMLQADPTKLAQFNNELKMIERGLQGIGSNATRSGLAGVMQNLNGIRFGIAGIAATITGAGLAGFYNYTKQLENLNAQLFSVSNNQHQANMDFRWAYAEATRLGTSVNMLGESFSKLSFAGRGLFDNKEVKEMTTSFLELSTVAGASAFQQEKGLYALQNMIGKRKIYSEELFQQMGEQIPMMLLAFEEAIIPKGSKQTLRQYMDEHKGISIDVLPKVAAAMKRIANEGGALENSLQRLEVVENATIGLFQKNMGELGQILKPSFVMWLRGFQDFLHTVQPILRSFARFLNLVLYGLGMLFRGLSLFTEGLMIYGEELFTNPSSFFKDIFLSDENKKKYGTTAEAIKQTANEVIVKVESNLGAMADFISVHAEQVYKGQMAAMAGMVPID